MPLRDAHRANVWTGWESVKQNKSFRLFEYGEHMNIDILRTFLAVAEHESLRRAADFMHLTPSAVSARIRQLERSLNTSLFERSKAGVQLTQAGQKLASRSRTLIREWQDIRQEVGSGGRDAVLLRLGAPDALWQARLLAATVDFRQSHANTHVVLKTGGRRELAAMLISDALDCVVLSEPLAHPGFESCRIATLQLLPVASPDMSVADAAGFAHYVDVDWGDAFHNKLAEAGVEQPVATVQINVAWLALDWLLRSGGTAWLPRYLVHRHIEDGRLQVIPSAGRLSLDVHAAFNLEHIEAEEMVRVLRASMADTEA